MKFEVTYDYIVKYHIEAECISPLHIGDDDNNVLIHPVRQMPFFPGTGLAGAFREAFKDKKIQNELFGYASDENAINSSKLRFSDALFEPGSVRLEIRPRVKIDEKSCTAQSVSTKDGLSLSGQKFDMEVISEGAKFAFDVYLFDRKCDRIYDCEKELESKLALLNHGEIQLGGQKSNGCGYIRLLSVKKCSYNMMEEQDRNAWINDIPSENCAEADLEKLDFNTSRYSFILSGKTVGNILVKAVAPKVYEKNGPDVVNISNGFDRYIIPASSVKGVVKSQIKKIIDFKHLDEGLTDIMFGKSSNDDEKGFLGILHFFDADILTEDTNEKFVQARIHIDKFTGGVMNRQLFKEKGAAGKLSIRVDMDKTAKGEAAALVLMALRDIGMGILPVGSESSIGRGYIEGELLTIKCGDNILSEINFTERQIEDKSGFIRDCFN